MQQDAYTKLSTTQNKIPPAALHKCHAQRDPREVKNLALDKAKYGDLLLPMNGKLNRLIDAEVDEEVDSAF